MNEIQLMARLEGSLSPSHVDQIRARCSTFQEYLALLESELKTSNEAIARLTSK